MGSRTWIDSLLDFAKSALVKDINRLNLRQPEMWPVLWRLCVFIGAGLIMWLAIAAIFITDLTIDFQNLRTEAQQLAKQIQSKREKEALLDPLISEAKKLHAQMELLDEQLPARPRWDELLSDVNQAGHRHKLELEWVKPEATRVSSQWVELPASVRIKGPFHALGGFVSELSHFNRLVTLGQLSLETSAKDTVTLQANLKVFRQRTPSETAAFREEKSVAALPFLQLAPAEYEGSARQDPFSPHSFQSTTQFENTASPPVRPASSSAKHPLENAPLESMSLVGQMLQGDRSVGLIRSKGSVYSVKVGAVIGTNQGRVSSVNSSGLLVLEKSTDASGRWSQRSTLIPMIGSTP